MGQLRSVLCSASTARVGKSLSDEERDVAALKRQEGWRSSYDVVKLSALSSCQNLP